jgi:hypothetical protein
MGGLNAMSRSELGGASFCLGQENQAAPDSRDVGIIEAILQLGRIFNL